MSKVFKSILLSAFVIIFSFSLFSCSGKTSFFLKVGDRDTGSACTYKKEGNSYFIFTEEQNTLIHSFVTQNNGAALSVVVNYKKTGENLNKKIYMGFLYSCDFVSPKKVVKSLSERPFITVFTDEIESDILKLSFSFSSDREKPLGFFIRSECDFEIKSAEIEKCMIGFDKTSTPQFFGFAPNGGVVKSKFDSFDLSAAPYSFNLLGKAPYKYPSVYVDFTESCYITSGGERLHLYKDQNDVSKYKIPCAALKSPFAQWDFGDNSSDILRFIMMAEEKPETLYSTVMNDCVINPVKCDPGLIMKWKKSSWRGKNYELFEWDCFDGILYFDTEDYAFQDKMFKRLAFYVEKSGWKEKLWTNEQINDKHGYNAHDYSAASLADFFNKAQKSHFTLNDEEYLLKEILIANNVLNDEGDGMVSEGKGAVISISQESPEYLRVTFVAHEGWHGLYFTDEDFRNTVAAVYYTMDQDTLSYLRRYFIITPSLNYDVHDDYLMKNEFMAYMLQQGISNTQAYFVNKASRDHSQTWAKDEADYIIRTNAEGFYSAAVLLDEYTDGRWGYRAGRIWHISR